MHLNKQCYKNQNKKNLLQYFNYSSNNAISLFKEPNICQLQNFTNLKLNHVFVCPPASLPTGTDLEPILLCIFLLHLMKISVISVGKNLFYSNHNTSHEPLPVLWLLNQACTAKGHAHLVS